MNKIKVTKLLRLDGCKDYPKKFYYSPDGYCSQPFDTIEEREAEIAKYYEEIPKMDSSIWPPEYKIFQD